MGDASKNPKNLNNDAAESAIPPASDSQSTISQQAAADLKETPAVPTPANTDVRAETAAPSTLAEPAATSADSASASIPAQTPVPPQEFPASAPAPDVQWRPVSADPQAAAVPPAGRPVCTPESQQAASGAMPQQPDFAQPGGCRPYEPYAAPQQPGSIPPGAVPPGAVPPDQSYPPNMPPYGYRPPTQASGKIIGALVCGILAILFCWTIVPSIILGIVAIVLAGKGVRESGPDGKATGAKVCGIVGIVFSVLTLAAALALGALVGIAASNGGSYSVEASRTWGDSSVHHPESGVGNSGGTTSDASEEAVRTAVAAEMDKLTAKDAAMVQEMARELDDEMRDSTEYLVGGKGISLTDAGVDPTVLAQWALDGMAYSVGDVYAYSTGNEADAYVDIDMRDVKAFGALYNEKLGQALAGSAGVTTDQVKSIVNSCINTAMSECQDRTSVNYCIEFENRGGVWTADDGWYDDLVERCFY